MISSTIDNQNDVTVTFELIGHLQGVFWLLTIKCKSASSFYIYRTFLCSLCSNFIVPVYALKVPKRQGCEVIYALNF